VESVWRSDGSQAVRAREVRELISLDPEPAPGRLPHVTAADLGFASSPKGVAAILNIAARVVALVGHHRGRIGITRILSSPGRGLPRPSRLLVVHQSEPSGARTTSRNRP
jgi:hypothetical protein